MLRAGNPVLASSSRQMFWRVSGGRTPCEAMTTREDPPKNIELANYIVGCLLRVSSRRFDIFVLQQSSVYVGKPVQGKFRYDISSFWWLAHGNVWEQFQTQISSSGWLAHETHLKIIVQHVPRAACQQYLQRTLWFGMTISTTTIIWNN